MGRSSRRKNVLRDDDKDYDDRREEEEEEMAVKDGVRSKRRGVGEEKETDKRKEVEEVVAQALPIGEPVRFFGKGRKRKKHYASFEGNVFELMKRPLYVPNG